MLVSSITGNYIKPIEVFVEINPQPTKICWQHFDGQSSPVTISALNRSQVASQTVKVEGVGKADLSLLIDFRSIFVVNCDNDWSTWTEIYN